MSALPKPLSQKSIQKMLDGWKPETVQKLYAYYSAFSNLYGVIMLSDAWKIIKQYEPKIHKKEFIGFSSIARRDTVPYYVLEMNELYSGETKVYDENRFIVNKELVLDGYYRFSNVYRLEEMQMERPYYCPERLLDFADNADSKQWNLLCDYIREIKNKDGVKLSELFVLYGDDKFILEYYQSQRKKDEILKRAEIPVSERLIKKIKLDMHLGINSMLYLQSRIKELGIDLSFEKYEEFLRLLTDANNYSNLWANSGWTPVSLIEISRIATSPTMTFGKGLQQAFANGDIDKNELIEKLIEMGFNLEE